MAGLETRALAPGFGVEVIGLEPRLPLAPDTIADLRGLFDDRGLLLFRGLDVDIRFQTYLSELLIGRDVPDPAALPVNDRFQVSNREPASAAPFGRLLYHSDQMWSADDRVDLISLFGKEVEQPAEPTLFVSAADAWDTLPEPLRAQVAGRSAIQFYDPEVYRKRARGDTDVLVSVYGAEVDAAVTPVALRHPRNGRTLLYVCQQTTQRIDGLDEAASDALLDALFDHLYAPGREFAHHWRQGDLIVWDNLALQHARPNVVAAGPARTLRKTLAPLPAAATKPNYARVAA